MIRSPFFYVGDKYKLMSQINKLVPSDIETFIEPFCGGGSAFMNSTAKFFLCNDINCWQIKLHKYLCKFKNNRQKFFDKFHNLINHYGLSASFLGKTVDDDLKKQHVKTYFAIYNKEAYDRAKRDFNEDQTNILLLYLLLIYGFNHMIRFNSKGQFNLPVGNVDYNSNVHKALNDYFDFIENNQINFFNKDFNSFVKAVQISQNDFVYCDPPYLITNSEYNKGWTFREEKKLLALLDELNSKNVRFALSNVLCHKGKKNDVLSVWATKYNVHVVHSNYISYYDNSIKNDTIEVLITNY